MFLHVIFPNPMIGLPIAFIGGIGFAVMYLRYPSLPLIILSHALINFFVVLYGFFVVPGVTY
jgi:membrane protease YdiL (CAAX protease family)